MCGIVAILSKSKSGFFHTDKTIFYQMLIADMFRGMDSTGVFGVNKHGNLKMIKDASSAPFFINKKDASEYMSEFISDFQMVVGHNRKATMGQVVSENAHPFIEGNICLVHNGTLTNHRKLADTTVDSHAICHHINEHGYKSMFKNIDGAYALIWYNAEEKTVYFARNSERPLYMVETNDKIYLASEDKMLEWILDRNNIAKVQCQIVPTDKVFKFNLDTRKLEAESKPKKESASKNGGQQWMQQNYQSRRHEKQSGNLHLAHSSEHSTQASISTYQSGEKIYFKCEDFDITPVSTKIIGQTLDEFKTACIQWLPNRDYPQVLVDQIINAQTLEGTITSITSKNGLVSLYLKDIKIVEEWKTRSGKTVNPKDLLEAGGCCYSCGVALTTPQDVEFASVDMKPNGDVTWIQCESCADSQSGITNFRSMYGGGYD